MKPTTVFLLKKNKGIKPVTISKCIYRILIKSIFLLFVFETQSHHLALAGLEALCVDQAGLKPTEILLPLPSGIKSMCHQIYLICPILFSWQYFII